MHFFLLGFIIRYPVLSYIVVFIAMIVEGDFTLFTSLFLSRDGFFDLAIILPVLYAGVLIGDLLWFLLGVKLSRLSYRPRLAAWMERVARPFDEQLDKKPFRTLFISKFIYNAHHPLLMRAGARRMNINDFIKRDMVASALWIFIVGGAGYFFSLSLHTFRHYMHFLEVGLLVGLVLFFIIERTISHLFQKAKKTEENSLK